MNCLFYSQSKVNIENALYYSLQLSDILNQNQNTTNLMKEINIFNQLIKGKKWSDIISNIKRDRSTNTISYQEIDILKELSLINSYKQFIKKGPMQYFAYSFNNNKKLKMAVLPEGNNLSNIILEINDLLIIIDMTNLSLWALDKKDIINKKEYILHQNIFGTLSFYNKNQHYYLDSLKKTFNQNIFSLDKVSFSIKDNILRVFYTDSNEKSNFNCNIEINLTNIRLDIKEDKEQKILNQVFQFPGN